MARIKIRLERPWIPYIILIVALLITCIVTFYTSRITQERDRLRFGNAVAQTQNTITNELEIYTALLRGTSGLFAENPEVTKTQFQTYINRLFLQQRYKGIQGIGFIAHVSGDQKDEFLTNASNQTQSDFIIKPTGDRSEYNVILYLEPKKTTNQAGIGLDMSLDPIRKAALDRARDTGLPAMSKKVILNQTTTKTKQPGFFIFVPVYADSSVPTTAENRQKEIIGYVFSPFRATNLFNTVLDSSSLPAITFKIYDGTQINQANVLHDSMIPNDQQFSNYNAPFQETKQLTVDGETWTIAYANAPDFEQASQENLPPFIFLGGLLISFMFFMLSRAQYLARAKAETYAQQLQRSQAELHKAIGLRNNFISIASHELKTPVTSLKVYAEVLQRRFSQTGEKQTIDYLMKMNKQIDKLTLLIHDLLDVSRLEAGHLAFRFEKFDLTNMVKEIVESIQPTATNHTIIIQGKVTKKVWGDRERIGQVLNNLLTNALKYSPRANKIVVMLVTEKESARISVQDFGIGISKEHQKKIFNRFYRVNGTNEQTFPGLGIGLYISNEIVRHHGSAIKITSNKGKGSVFSFNLPYQQKGLSK